MGIQEVHHMTRMCNNEDCCIMHLSSGGGSHRPSFKAAHVIEEQQSAGTGGTERGMEWLIFHHGTAHQFYPPFCAHTHENYIMLFYDCNLGQPWSGDYFTGRKRSCKKPSVSAKLLSILPRNKMCSNCQGNCTCSSCNLAKRLDRRL